MFDHEDQDETYEVKMDVDISVRDVPAFMKVIMASTNLIMRAKFLGFDDAPEIQELHKALVCLSPDLDINRDRNIGS